MPYKKQSLNKQTFGYAYDLYEIYADQHLKSALEICKIRKRYLLKLDGRRLDSITRLELQQLHSEIGARSGKTAANRCLEIVSAVFNRAIDYDLFPGPNPAQRIKKFRLRSRERFIQPDEISALFNAIEQCGNAQVRDFLLLCIYTAARSGKVMSMRWEDIDIQRGVWYLQDDKNGDSYRVPLVPQAIELLKARQAGQQGRKAGFVFPAARGSGHMENPRKTWYKILRQAGVVNLRIHDLRRSHASWQARCGVPLNIIGRSLNHRDYKSTLIYARVDDQPVRAAMMKAVEAMLDERSF